MSWAWAGVAALLLAASCSSDDPDVPASDAAPSAADAAPLDAGDAGAADAAVLPSAAVRGTLVGLGEGVELGLHLVAGEVDELLTLTSNGSFEFLARFDTPVAYTVTIASAVPADHECVVEGGAGMIENADVTIEVRCRNAQLSAIDTSAPSRFDPLFDPTIDSYDVFLSVLAQDIDIRAAAADLAGVVRIDGVGDGPVAIASRSLPLGSGPTADITVVAGAAMRSYALALHRVRIAEERAYLTAPRPEVATAFGDTIAGDGDTLVVGVFTDPSGDSGVNGDETDTSMPDSGAVHVYRRGVAGWQREAYLKASNPSPGDNFGTSVAICGDVIAVGAPAQDGGGGWASGAVYVFRRTSAGWAEEDYLKAPLPRGGEQLGQAVACGADLVAAGAGDGINHGTGGVHVFARTDLGWEEETYLTAANGEADDALGSSLSMSGDTLAVGAIGEDGASPGVDGDPSSDAALESGAVYVFRRDATTWTQEAYVKASNPDPTDGFGVSLSLSGDMLVVGAPFEDSAASGQDGDGDDNTAELAGAVYVYRRSGSSWSHVLYLKSPETTAAAFFGWSVAARGDLVAVGVPRDDAAGTDAGAVHLYANVGDQWGIVSTLDPLVTSARSGVGESVALTRDALAAGALHAASGAGAVIIAE